MKRVSVYLALVLPVLLLGFWYLFPQADLLFNAPLFHFYIVTFTTFAATVVSIFVTISVGQTALPRHLLLATAFAWMGAAFFVHGFTTPGALIHSFHPGIVWGAWLTFFGGGVVFLIGAFAPNSPDPRLLQTVAVALLVAYLAFASLAVSAPTFLNQLLRLNQPPLDLIVFVLTMLVWLVSGVKHYQIYRQTHNQLDGLMAFECVWFAIGTVSMLGDAVLGVFPQSHLSWWLYHVLLLIGFLIAIVFLWRAYEQIRAFRLSRYYAAASLIVTAALALLSAHVYSQQVYRDLLTQLESNTAAVSQNIAIELAAELPEVQTVEDVRRLSNLGQVPEMVRERLAGLQVQSVFLYDADGVAVFSTEEAWMGTRATTPPEEFAATLDQGETTFELHAPGAPPRAYQPASPVFILQTYVPFRPGGDAQAAPIGVLVTIREAPVLSQSLTDSRRAGLGLAALSLGGLFVALLAIVRRADQIITTRTRELEHAYADLRQAESMRDDLTYMIVHDLRNPLAAITTNLDLITRTIHDPKFADAPPRFLNSARGAGQRMMGMIDDLLNVSKYEAGELRPVLAPLYLPTFLAEKAEGYRMQADREQKSLSAHVSPDLPMVMADAGLIGRVVDNLVSNAFKYTSQGGHIEISTACTPDTVLVHVRDDGQGIPREYHQRIFEKFVQVTDGTGAPLRKGTGLGLALCRIAVEAHHGRIWVESAPGQGSTFTFTLPASPPEDGAPG